MSILIQSIGKDARKIVDSLDHSSKHLTPPPLHYTISLQELNQTKNWVLLRIWNEAALYSQKCLHGDELFSILQPPFLQMKHYKSLATLSLFKCQAFGQDTFFCLSPWPLKLGPAVLCKQVWVIPFIFH